MIVPINWLKEYIDLSEDPKEIAQAFTSIGYMLDRPITEVNGDTILDLEVRQNRPDCLSLIGLARELGAILKRDIRFPEESHELGSPSETTRIDIPDSSLCKRFHAITFENIHVKESPEWLRNRLESYGVKTINNIVDITNYVSIEYGMPMHAYDANRVTNRHITIRAAQKGEKLTVFGGKEVHFDTDDIIHADPDGPIGFGALMGGEDKSVHDDTTAIILEAAVYNQASVRRSSRRHSIRTEASTRLEKFLHPELTESAIRRAVHLVKELAEGNIVDNTDAYPAHDQQTKITFDSREVKRLGGVDVDIEEMKDILRRLDITYNQLSDTEFEATIPYSRSDIEQEADLVEEILRIHGYDKIPEQLPQTAPPKSIQSQGYEYEERVRDIMTALGYDEVITEPLTHEDAPARDPIYLENSLTSEKTMLRTSMTASMEHALEERKKYRQTDIRLFEIGKIYFKEGTTFREQRALGFITSGKHSYLDVKGDIELITARLGYPHHVPVQNFEVLPHSVCIAELNLDALFDGSGESVKKVISTPPQVIFHDFALTIPRNADVKKIIDDLKSLDEMISSVEYITTQKSDETSKEIILKVIYSSTGEMISENNIKPTREKILQYIKELG